MGHRIPTSQEIEVVLSSVYGFGEPMVHSSYKWLARLDDYGKAIAQAYVPTDPNERMPLPELSTMLFQAGIEWHEFWGYLG